MNICCCFKKKISRDLQDRVKDRLLDQTANSYNDFRLHAEKEEISLHRVTASGSNKEHTEYGTVYNPKPHHPKIRRKLIELQNKFWADMPLTILAILSLFCIPVFQYCHETVVFGNLDPANPDVQQAHRFSLLMIWLNYVLGLIYAGEIAIKCYAYGLRRAFLAMDWVLATEFVLYQPCLWVSFAFFISGHIKYDANEQVNFFSMGILLRVLRVTNILTEITLWRNFIRTLRALMRPFFNFGVTLYSLYLIYASIGLEFFGGVINQNSV